MHDHFKHVSEAASVLAASATLIGWIANALPPLAALVSILWMGFQWYHSAPMKARRGKAKERTTDEPESKTGSRGDVA
jgi:hypothetical protein